MPEYYAKKVVKYEITDPDSLPKALIDCCPWEQYPKAPEAEAAVCYTDEALFVRLTARDKDPRITYYKDNDPVYKDSCLEFFASPEGHENAFCDFECNAAGTLLIGHYDNGDFRSIDPETRRDEKVKAEIEEDRWQVLLEIPFDFFKREFPGYDTGKKVFNVNFYKCGDETRMPHYSCWSRIKSPEISFFHPEDFGRLILN